MPALASPVMEIASLSELFQFEENDDPNRKTHIINPPKNIHIWRQGMSSQDVVDIARATGQEVVALCDYRWVPKHNPEKFDVCDTCLTIAGELMRSANE